MATIKIICHNERLVFGCNRDVLGKKFDPTLVC